MFCCHNSDLSAARLVVFKKLDEQVRKISVKEVADAIAVGVRSIGQDNSADLYRREFVVSIDVTQAMTDQGQIGWDHFLMSRMAKKWTEIGPNEHYTSEN